MDHNPDLNAPEKEDEKRWSSRDKYSSDEEQAHASPRSPSERHRDSHRHEKERQASPKNGDEFRECCKDCNRDHRRNGRACICQVPSSQRRAPLGESGCITCGCTGCHAEDQQRKKDLGIPLNVKKENPSSSAPPRVWSNEPKLSDDAPLKNGCCKPCMRAFSETKRACLCQVPYDVRIGSLPPGGCKVCGCKGCHPEELLMKKKGAPLKHRRGPAPGSRIPPHYPAPPFYPFGDPYMRPRYEPYGRDSYRHGDRERERYRSHSRSPERGRGRSPRRFHSDAREKSPTYRKERSRSRDRTNRKRDRSRERSASPGRKDRRQE